MHYEIVSERGDAVTTLVISRFTKKTIDLCLYFELYRQ